MVVDLFRITDSSVIHMVESCPIISLVFEHHLNAGPVFEWYSEYSNGVLNRIWVVSKFATLVQQVS